MHLTQQSQDMKMEDVGFKQRVSKNSKKGKTTSEGL
jgi:hypothetical protein